MPFYAVEKFTAFSRPPSWIWGSLSGGERNGRILKTEEGRKMEVKEGEERRWEERRWKERRWEERRWEGGWPWRFGWGRLPWDVALLAGYDPVSQYSTFHWIVINWVILLIYASSGVPLRSSYVPLPRRITPPLSKATVFNFTLSIKWHKCATQCTDEILTSSIKKWKLLIPTAVERVRTEGELEQRYKPPLVVVTQCRSRSAAVYRSSSLPNSSPPRTSWHLIKTKSQLSHKHANITINGRW